MENKNGEKNFCEEARKAESAQATEILEVEEDLQEFSQNMEYYQFPIAETPIALTCHNAENFSEPRNIADLTGHYNSIQQLRSLRFAPCTKRIAPYSFCGSRNLKQLTLPEGLESIGAGAFARCEALEEVVIPESVTEIGPSAFAKCTALHRVQMSNTLAGKLDGSVFMMTPFAQNQHPLNALPLFNETLVVGLGDDVNNRALLAFADVMDGEQDLLCMSIYAGRLELAAISFHECILAKEKQGAFRSKFYTIQMGKKLRRDMPKNIFPDSGTPELRDEEPDVRRILARYRFVIVAVRIGDIEGSGVPPLAQWLREMEIPHIVLALMPFAFDVDENSYDTDNSVLIVMKEANDWAVEDYKAGNSYLDFVRDVINRTTVNKIGMQTWYNLGRWVEAIRHPEKPTEEIAGMYREALAALKSAAITNINKATGYARAGSAYRKIAQSDIAIQTLQAEIEIVKPNVVLFALGRGETWIFEDVWMDSLRQKGCKLLDMWHPGYSKKTAEMIDEIKRQMRQAAGLAS